MKMIAGILNRAKSRSQARSDIELSIHQAVMSDQDGMASVGSMPDADSAEIMMFVDSLPKKWRALVYEYGYQQVMARYNSGMKLKDADDELWMMRSAAQAKWLSTNFITKRVVRSYE
jgi:hypothetical protein